MSPTLNARVGEVTQRIAERSRDSRRRYLESQSTHHGAPSDATASVWRRWRNRGRIGPKSSAWS
jgi:hypothetical protein